MHLLLLEKYEEKKAADALCLAVSLDNPTALLKIAHLKTIKHKGLILGTLVDNCSFEESELKKAYWEFKYNLLDAKKILQRVETLELDDNEKKELKRLKEKIGAKN